MRKEKEMIRFNKKELETIQEYPDLKVYGQIVQDLKIVRAKATLMLQEGNYEGYKVRRRKARLHVDSSKTIGGDSPCISVRKNEVQREQLEESAPYKKVPEGIIPPHTPAPKWTNA
jgi:hypothetical protein